MAIATSKAIQQIILREYKKDSPAFAIIDLLQVAFKKALAIENNLSIEDMAPSTPRHVLSGGGSVNMVTGNTGSTVTLGYGDDQMLSNDDQMMSNDEYNRRHGNPRPHRGERNRQAESLKDQVLSALDQAVTRQAGNGSQPVDRLLAVVQAIPHLEVIYPDPEERRRIMQAIQFEIGSRLGDSMRQTDPVESASTPLLENLSTENDPNDLQTGQLS